MPDETPKVNMKLATECEHTDRPAKGFGKCQSCYRAQRKLEVQSKAGKLASRMNSKGGAAEPVAEKRAAEVLQELEMDKDPELKREFLQIMWGWLRAPQEVPECWVGDARDGKRDWASEARLGETAQKKADKAATVLGRAYVTEKVDEVKPQPLPIGGATDTSGWFAAAADEESDENEDERDDEE